MRYDTTLRDDDITKEFVQFFIVADGQLQVARNDTNSKVHQWSIRKKRSVQPNHVPLLLVITRGVARQLENLSGEIFKDRGEVDGCTSTDTLRVVPALEHTVDTTDGELKAGF